MLGDYVRKVRKDKGLKQSDVAEQVGVTPTTISRWERGSRQIAPKYLGDLADALGISRSELTSRSVRGQTPSEGRYANTRASVTDWMSSVLSSGHTPDEKLVLAAIAAFYDDDIRAVPISKAELIEETSIGESRVNGVWDTIVDSEYLERRGRSRWTFKLRFPTPDSETIDA